MDSILSFVLKVNGTAAVLGATCEQNTLKYECFALFLGCSNVLTMRVLRCAVRTRRGASAANVSREVTRTYASRARHGTWVVGATCRERGECAAMGKLCLRVVEFEPAGGGDAADGGGEEDVLAPPVAHPLATLFAQSSSCCSSGNLMPSAQVHVGTR